MKIISLAVIFILFTGILQSQTKDELLETIEKLKSDINILKQDNIDLQKQLKSFSSSIDKQVKDLRVNLTELETIQVKKTDELSELQRENSKKILKTDSLSSQKISALDKSLTSSTNFWVMGIAFAIIISLFIYYLLRKKVYSQKSLLDQQIIKTRKELEVEGIKIDNKLIEILNSQLKIIDSSKSQNSDEKDHSLALKVADEIVRIEKNLSNMDPTLKGHKQLDAAVKRIKDNFEASGYEIVDMLNKPFDEGINANVNFRVDDNLVHGEQIISRIIKPQVNYKGRMIQTSQIEVSQGE